MQHRDVSRPLRIGELATELGINPKTVRYYEEIGLLPPPARSPAGYRLYGAADRERLRFIVSAKAIGLTLAEIGEVLKLRGEGRCPCGHVLSLIDRKLAAVDEWLRALGDFRQELAALKDAATGAGAADAPICGIIEHRDPGQRTARTPLAVTPTLHRSSPSA